MNKRTFYYIVVVSLMMYQFIPDKCNAQSHRWYINPGAKIGYVFGDNDGFMYGFELSLTTIRDDGNNAWGILFSTEHNHYNRKIIHLGVEIFPRVLYGLSIGPSIITTNQESKIGITTTVFGGLFILPYYRFTYSPDSIYMHEVGTFLKLIAPLQKENFNVGG